MSKERRGLIWGRRIVGDMLMDNDPVTQRLGRFYGPAQSLTNIAQDYEEISATQNYMLSSKMIVDERVFRYARTTTGLVNPCTYRLSANGDLNAATTWGLAIPAPGIVVGDTTIRVTHNNFGIVATTVGLNELSGGWIEIWPAAGGSMWRRILSNSASVAGVPAYLDIVVDRPANIACAAGAGTAALHRSAYYNIVVPTLYSHYASAAGVAPVPVTALNYFWLQTWGPCVLSSTGASPGFTADYRDAYMHFDGTINSASAELIATATHSPQRVGYVMGASTTGDGNNDVMLQLAN